MNDALQQFVQAMNEEMEWTGDDRESVSVKAGMARCRYSHIASGRQSPNLKTLELLARAVNCEIQINLRVRDVSDLEEEEGEPEATREQNCRTCTRTCIAKWGSYEGQIKNVCQEWSTMTKAPPRSLEEIV